MPITSCYRNLHKNCISIKTGKEPVKHGHSIVLKNVYFHVNENGRQKTLRRQQKNVHAQVKGYNPKEQTIEDNTLVKVSYNPYKFGYFYQKKDGKPVYYADWAVVTTDGVWAKNPR